MNQDKIIENTIAFVKEQLSGAEGGHDWWHIHRVWTMAKCIGKEEGARMLIVELAALLHDIADPKFHDGDESIGPRIASEFLLEQKVLDEDSYHILSIIKNMSFKNSFDALDYYSPELDVVRDADRLDAIGAIGIARAFSFGGFKKRPFYDPEIQPEKFTSKEDYKKSAGPTINHFYEKLLLLKEGMTTPTGQRLAEERHQFMLNYLDQFYAEWEGRK